LKEYVHIDILEFCLDHKILLICLPSYSTHYLQTLDVAVFSSYQYYYSAEVDKFSRVANSGIGKENFLRILFPAQDNTFASEKRLAAKAFEGTSIWPLNQARIRDRFPPPPPTPPQPPHYERPIENHKGSLEKDLRTFASKSKTPQRDPNPLMLQAADEIAYLSSEVVQLHTELACKEVELEKTVAELERIKGTKSDRRVLTKTRLCTAEYLAQRKRERDGEKGIKDTQRIRKNEVEVSKATAGGSKGIEEKENLYQLVGRKRIRKSKPLNAIFTGPSKQ